MTHDDDDHDVLARGTRVSEFRVERLLGRGGFGATYLAWDESLEAWRAVKEYLPVGWRGAWGRRLRDGTVGPARGREEEYRWGLERFVREARVLSDRRLKHPNIVGVYRCFPARGTAYLVMELVEGRSLAKALSEEGGWPEARVRPLLSGLANGLSAVHAAGLLHRDVSAANVMLRAEDDSPVLIDFGTARKPEDQGLSIPLVKAGYAAFEQYKGEWEAYKGSAAYRGTRTDGGKADQGPWTDVYGLGAVAYVALSGAVPPAATERFVHDGLRPVSEASVGPVSGALASAVDAALSVVPSERPQRMGEWLSLWRDESSVPSPLPEPELQPPGVREEKPAEGGRRWWLYGASAAMVVTAVVAWSIARGGDAGLTPAAPPPTATERPTFPPEAPGAGAADGEVRPTGSGEPNAGVSDPVRPTGSGELGAGRGREFRDTCAGCPQMVVVPAGTFLMGTPASEEGRFVSEGPQRRVTIGAAFAVGVHEVTFAEWDACVAAGGCGGYRPDDAGWGRGTRPVVSVHWSDAQAYVSWLSSSTGASYRLLSESEWEYVARAGTATRYWWGDSVGRNRANCYEEGCGDAYASTAPVGSYSANGFGLFDVSGNVWEWVQDCWHEDYNGAPTDGSAWGGSTGCRRVVRGGSWSNGAEYLRPGARFRSRAGNRSFNGGFRVARTLD